MLPPQTMIYSSQLMLLA